MIAKWAGLVTFAVMLAASPAFAAISQTVKFSSLDTNPSPDDAFFEELCATFSTDVNGDGKVVFSVKLEWDPTAPTVVALNGGTSPFVTEIYLFDGILAGSTVTLTQTGVSFGSGGSIQSSIFTNLDQEGVYGGDSNLPNYIAPSQFTPAYAYTTDPNTPNPNSNAIAFGDSLTITFTTTLTDENDIWEKLIKETYLADDNQKTGKIGLVVHVQGLNTTAGSEWGYTSVLDDPRPADDVVPEPASLALWGLGMGLIGFGARRRMQKAKA